MLAQIINLFIYFIYGFVLVRFLTSSIQNVNLQNRSKLAYAIFYLMVILIIFISSYLTSHLIKFINNSIK